MADELKVGQEVLVRGRIARVGVAMVKVNVSGQDVCIDRKDAAPSTPSVGVAEQRALVEKWNGRATYYSALSSAQAINTDAAYFEAKPRCYKECADELTAAIDRAEKAAQSATDESGLRERRQRALELFMEYFCTNYPGPQTIITNPKWHAPKIFAAAEAAIKAAARSTVQEKEQP